jgi:hypothetical protein
MKTKAIIIVILMISIGSVAHLNAGLAYNLNGEWDAIISKAMPNAALSTSTEKEIIKISQQGDQFVGIKTIGGKWVGKNEESIKGKLIDKMVDEAFVRYASDPITFDLSWSDGRATITEDGNKIVIQSYIPDVPLFVTITLTRKK